MRHARANAYVETAIATHRSYLSGGLSLDIRSDSPEVLTAWIARKLPFGFRVPAFQQTSSGKPVYRLVGARLVSFRGQSAALLAYEMQEEKISLLITSRDAAIAAGGHEVGFGGLVFHDRTTENLRVVTWTNHGLTYALVSSVAGAGQHSCLVCHQNMSDHENFQ
jgi:hypothetical protein